MTIGRAAAVFLSLIVFAVFGTVGAIFIEYEDGAFAWLIYGLSLVTIVMLHYIIYICAVRIEECERKLMEEKRKKIVKRRASK